MQKEIAEIKSFVTSSVAATSNLEDFYKASLISHQGMTEKFGDQRVVLEQNIVPKNTAIDTSEAGKFFREVEKISGIPTFIAASQILRSSLNFVGTNGKAKPIRTSQYIIKEYEKKKIPKEKMDAVKNEVSKLAELWRQKETSKDKFFVHIMWAPIDFVKTGTSRVDSGSCFKAGGCNERHKFFISQSQNTFIGYVTKTKELYLGEVVLRFFGKLDLANQAVHFFNKYPKTPENFAAVQEACEKTAAELLGVEKVFKLEEKFWMRLVYHNPKSTTSYFAKRTPLNIDRIEVFPDISNFDLICPSCRATLSNNNYITLDGYHFYCPTCAAGYVKSNVLDRFHRIGGGTLARIRGEQSGFSTDEIQSCFSTSIHDGLWYRNNELWETNKGRLVLKEWADKNFDFDKENLVFVEDRSKLSMSPVSNSF